MGKEIGKEVDRILLISRSIPPETSGTAIIVNNLAKQFDSSRMLICGEKVYGKPKIRWGHKLPNIKYIVSALPPGYRGERWFRKLQIPFSLLKLLMVSKKFKPTKILCVYPKQEYLLMGYLLSKLTGVSLYPYFHNTYVENNSGMNRILAKILQKRVFSIAPLVYVISEGMVQLYKKNYPTLQNLKPLRHTFNEELPKNVDEENLLKEPRNFVFAGNVNYSCEDAARIMLKVISSKEGHRLTLYTSKSKEKINQLGIKRDNFLISLISRDILVDKLREHDVMLLPHGFKGELPEEEYKTIFPTKTIEYLISGRPILYFGPKGAFITEFLRKNKCALIVDIRSEKELRKAINELKNNQDLRIDLVKNALRTAKLFYAPNVVQEMLKDMEMTDNHKPI